MAEEQEKAARDRLAKETEARAQQAAAMKARAKGKPTPTTEELNLVALGVDIDTVGRKDDGSGPDPHYEQSRAMWPKRNPAGGYQTR